MTTYSCGNCDFQTDNIDELDDIQDFAERHTPGDTVAHGQCPDCGALCFEHDPEPAITVPKIPFKLPVYRSGLHLCGADAELICLMTSATEEEASAIVDLINTGAAFYAMRGLVVFGDVNEASSTPAGG